MNELHVLPQQVLHRVGVLPRLLPRTRHHLVPGAGIDGEAHRVHVADRIQVPILDLERQHATARMQDQEIGMLVPRADGEVEPAEVVVFKQGAQAVGKAALAGVGGLPMPGLERKVATRGGS